ncbi:MAG: MATE family efflux transporter [Bacteroidales bacterium]|nr:MATE family efflux transporter [Bacteroidales bacterium]
MVTERAPEELGTKDVGKLLGSYALPAIAAQTASSLYNMADAAFIGQGVGARALAGLALTFPIVNLSVAVGTLCGVGASAVCSMMLGRKDYANANKVLGNVVVLNIITGVLFMIAALIWLDPLLRFFGASEESIGYAADYMRVILYGNVLTHLYFGLNGLLRSSGHPKFAMIATFVSVAVNCILDPLFIFVFHWGIKGAAYATLIAQATALVWTSSRFFNKGEVVHFRRGCFRLDKQIVLESTKIGMSPFLLNTVACLITVSINYQLSRYGGDAAIGAYGIVNRVIFVLVMVLMGLCQGMQPIVGYNYGSGDKGRMWKAFNITLTYGFMVTFLGSVICLLFPHQIIRIFTDDAEMFPLTVRALKFMVSVFALVGPAIVINNFFQFIGKPKRSIFLTLTRQVLFLIPLLWLLPPHFGTDGVWLGFPISDLFSSLCSYFVIWISVREHRHFKILKRLAL